MKKIFYSLFAIITVWAVSCTKVDTQGVLKTIPKDTPLLAVVNVKGIDSKLGKDAKGEKIELDDLIEEAIKGKGKGNKVAAEKWEYIFSDDSDADLSSPMILFEYKNSMLLTFALKDGADFREEIEDETHLKFSKNAGVWTLSDNTIYVYENQAWITSGYPVLSDADILGFSSLSPEESALSIESVARMAESDRDISLFCNLGSLGAFGSQGLEFGINSLYQKASFVEGYIDFNQGKAEGEFTVLDDKCRPASMVIRPTEIDMAGIEKFHGKGNLFFALNIDRATMESLLKQFKSVNMLPAQLTESLGGISGDILGSVYTGGQNSSVPQFSLMITMADNSSALKMENLLHSDLLPAGTKVNVEDNLVFISSGEEQGVEISEAASSFAGADLAVVFLTSPLPDNGKTDIKSLFSGAVIRMVSKGESSVLEFTVNTTPNQNSLVSLLKLISSNGNF